MDELTKVPLILDLQFMKPAILWKTAAPAPIIVANTAGNLWTPADLFEWCGAFRALAKLRTRLPANPIFQALINSFLAWLWFTMIILLAFDTHFVVTCLAVAKFLFLLMATYLYDAWAVVLGTMHKVLRLCNTCVRPELKIFSICLLFNDAFHILFCGLCNTIMIRTLKLMWRILIFYHWSEVLFKTCLTVGMPAFL